MSSKVLLFTCLFAVSLMVCESAIGKPSSDESFSLFKRIEISGSKPQRSSPGHSGEQKQNSLEDFKSQQQEREQYRQWKRQQREQSGFASRSYFSPDGTAQRQSSEEQDFLQWQRLQQLRLGSYQSRMNQRNSQFEQHKKLRLATSDENISDSVQVQKGTKMYHDTYPEEAGNGRLKANQQRQRAQNSMSQESSAEDAIVNRIYKNNN